ncbi:Crp/Fnr family transcriptional regulator [Algoriphagus sp.]|uniref:Crp/Fnr family transcriptional regulator n=1 Tax=Algoriphagus sp. TaxID=1872435 RepID=UPI003F727017
MEVQYKMQLVEFFNQLLPISEEELKGVFPFVHQESLKRGTVLKHAGEVDVMSRFLCKGFIGLYKDKGGEMSLEHIFGEGDVAREFHSYYSGEKQDYYLKSISDVVFLKMSAGDQERVLDKYSKLALLNSKMMDYVIQKRSKITGVRIRGLHEGYGELLKTLPGIGIYLTRQELADFFNCSTSKVARWRRKINQNNI